LLKWWLSVTACVVLIFAVCFSAAADSNDKTGVSVSARCAVLYCANNNSVVFEKNAYKKMSMASTTKIMTSLIALENAQANDKEVAFTKEMIAEGSSMYLKEGYRLRLSDLAVGMMTVSGNDAANAAAVSIAGSVDEFSKLMNEKAEQIGMNSTNFVTPSGLDDDNHYSTAYDMALLMNYALSNSSFAELTAKKTAEVTFIQPKDMTISYRNHNRLLSLYQYCTGGKTGFTKKSGRCLVTSAEKDGVCLIAVTLNAPDDWNDHINMYSYGFSRLTAVKNADKNFSFKADVVGGMTDTVEVRPAAAVDYVKQTDSDDGISRRVIINSFLYAPLEKGQVVGRAEYYSEGKAVCTIPLITEKAVDYKEKEKSFFENIFDWCAGVFK